MQPRPGIDDFAARLAELASAKEADAVAVDVAVANRYLRARSERAASAALPGAA